MPLEESGVKPGAVGSAHRSCEIYEAVLSAMQECGIIEPQIYLIDFAS